MLRLFFTGLYTALLLGLSLYAIKPLAFFLIFLSGYAILTAVQAYRRYPSLLPLLGLFVLGFGFIGLLGVLQGVPQARR